MDRSEGHREGGLVVVSTPIGNLGDLSPRAAETLRGADLVAAEDTRRTGRLLAHVGSNAPQISFHEHNEDQRLPDLLARVAAGQTVALVTDAGTPGISDPGYRLVRACVRASLRVEAVPGPSAVIQALVVSGLATDRFAFEGFLPRRQAARSRRLTELGAETRTIVLYVSPHRAVKDLDDLVAALGPDRPAALCRELTKLHEEVVRAPVGELAERVRSGGVRGEVTLVVSGVPARHTSGTRQDPTSGARQDRSSEARQASQMTADPGDLADEVSRRVKAGTSKKSAIAEVAAEAGVPKRDVYQAVVEAGSSS
ncbi:MAG: 16S rRNA (cytidine(1402)-2'-O)-methyltransferase [Actinomycetota bacterium]|nr:16S rRNA (cytidine(1402)-2'-O)-methyltransferase [Actinomycetota bacterium]